MEHQSAVQYTYFTLSALHLDVLAKSVNEWQGTIYTTFPEHITHFVFLEGTSHSMLLPRIKKPVPAHHLHSTWPED
jgi:hypothetical protein